MEQPLQSQEIMYRSAYSQNHHRPVDNRNPLAMPHEQRKRQPPCPRNNGIIPHRSQPLSHCHRQCPVVTHHQHTHAHTHAPLPQIISPIENPSISNSHISISDALNSGRMPLANHIDHCHSHRHQIRRTGMHTRPHHSNTPTERKHQSTCTDVHKYAFPIAR